MTLLEFLSAWDLEEPTPEGLEELGALFKTADVVVTTKEHPTLMSNKRPRVVLDQAISGEERVAVVDLPRIGERGCSFEWKDLAAAVRLRKLATL